MYLKGGKPYWILIKQTKVEAIILAAIAVFVGYFDNNLYLLEEFSLAVPAFLSITIVVSLSFKTNKGYQRWWEAKMIWEAITNSTRAWKRLVNAYIKGIDPELARKLIKIQVAWNYVLKARLRSEPHEVKLDRFLPAQDLEFLDKMDNLNQGLLFLQSRELKKEFDQQKLPVLIHVEFEEIIRELEVSMGKAERIKNTHFPVLYDRIIMYSIFLFCAIATYFISDGTVFFEASVSFVISYLFLLFATISQDLEDPFEGKPSDTPMSEICRQLHKESLEDIDENILWPQAIEKTSHFVM